MGTDEFIILSKLRLASIAVGAILKKAKYRRFAYLKDDLESAAKLALVRALKSGELRDSFLMQKMKRAATDCIDKEASTIRIPERTQQDAKKKGKSIAEIKCTSLKEDHEDPRSGDLLTTILDCCRDDRERRIIQLKAARHTDAHIAEQVGVSRSRITQIIADIERRYDCDECGGDSPFIRLEQTQCAATHCRCGQPIEKRFANEMRCEDCVAYDAFRLHGRSQRVRVNLKAA